MAKVSSVGNIGINVSLLVWHLHSFAWMERCFGRVGKIRDGDMLVKFDIHLVSNILHFLSENLVQNVLQNLSCASHFVDINAVDVKFAYELKLFPKLCSLLVNACQ